MILEGNCAWAHVQKSCGEKTLKTKNGKSFKQKDEYRLDLFISDTKAEELREKGYWVKTAKEVVPGIDDSKGRPFIKISSKATFPSGDPTPKPGVFDVSGKEFTGLIGNGSRVQVQYVEYEYDNTFTGKKCVSCRLENIMIIDLVNFDSDKKGNTPSKKPEFKFDKDADVEALKDDDVPW